MIISISGLIGSGKDTVSEYLTEQHNFQKLSFASSLKDAVAAVFGWQRELLEGSTAESRQWRDEVDLWWANRLGMPHLTPRWVLQNWGTEVCRQGFHPDIWIASLEHKLQRMQGNVVITDARFRNELDMVKRVGGTTMRVSRGERPMWYPWAVTLNTSKELAAQRAAAAQLHKHKIHASEYSGVGLMYDVELENNSTIGSLWLRVMASICD